MVGYEDALAYLALLDAPADLNYVSRDLMS
jgi:hypothetical protein